ncbi:MAG: ribosome maturation factor RimM [Pseudomonadota bacterium]|nr:ribosome maturation factor RimM [Pseudomonadota bacterium]
MSKAPGRILVGKFGAPHGVRGEIRLKSFTEDPEAIAGYETLATEDGEPVEILSLRPQGAMLVARLKGSESREAAEKLTNLELFIERSELPAPEDEDEFYLADLIGLDVVEAGESIGKVAAVQDFGAGDILEVKPATGASFMVAFTRETVPEIDLDAGHLVLVRPAETEAREAGTDEGGEDR